MENLGIINEQYAPASSSKILPIFSVLCTPLTSRSKTTLDSIFTQTAGLAMKARVLLTGEASMDQLRHLEIEARKLLADYEIWPETLSSKEWWPRSIGTIAMVDIETK
jgi:hypothetical protein